MAMSGGGSRPGVDERVSSAARSLRDHTDDRWVEVRDEVLTKVMSHPRPSHPVAALAPGGPFHVSEKVLERSLLDAVDPVPNCEVAGIVLHADRDRCRGVTIALRARYPEPLIALADAVRLAASERLSDILGPVTPAVTVATMHVHVADVTREDPKRG